MLAVLWARTLAAPYLLAAGLCVLAGLALLAGRPAGRVRRAGRLSLFAALAATGLALVAGAVTQRRLAAVSSDWDTLSAQRSAALRNELDDRLSALFIHGRETAERAATLSRRASGRALFASLEALRRGADVAAVALFDPSGEPVAWAGDHRGTLPESVLVGKQPVVYAERPLFSYLYFSAPVGDDGAHAVAVILMQTGPRLGPGHVSGFAPAFQRATGVRLRFTAGAAERADWRYPSSGPTDFSATIEPLSQSVARERVAAMGRRVVLLLLALAFVLLTAGWLRRRPAGRGRFAAPLVAAALVLALTPLAAVLPVSGLFSPGLFMLPVGADVTLGPLLAVLVPIAALLALWRAPPVRARGFLAWTVAGAVLVPLGFALGLRFLLAGAGPTLLNGSPALWWGLQPAAVLLLGSLAVPGFARARVPVLEEEPRPGPQPRWGLLLAGAGFAAVASILVLIRWQSGDGPPQQPGALPLRSAALWAVPFVMMALGLARRRAPGGRLLRTLAAGWLAATFVLPNLWAAHVGAQLSAAERSLGTLGSRSDPYVAFLLQQFGDDLERRQARGSGGVDLLFRSWLESGLAEKGYPVQLVLWDRAGEPYAHLQLAGASDLSLDYPPLRSTLRQMLVRARSLGGPLLDSEPTIPRANQIMVVPLPNGSAATVVVEPRRALEFMPALLGFLGAQRSTDTRLTLIATQGGPVQPGWHRTETGWRIEAQLRYPEGLYHAHLDVRTPPLMVEIARGTLLAAVDLATLLLLWALGRAAEVGWRRPSAGSLGWLGSFRARVTLALFAFFLVPTIAFGAFAYRALAGEAVRSATLLGQRAVEQAVEAFPTSANLVMLADHVGEEVLYYFRGGLAQASSEEALQLGLYGAWMPHDVYLALQDGEEIGTTRLRRVLDRPYTISFRALRPAGTLAVPVSLAAGDAVARQRELTHLVLFAVLLGGLFSLALSLMVARAFSRPIGLLRRAAAAVGAGRLDVRLPEARTDEFGELFASFNRMVRRLRRARSREIRTARVLAWGEMARQVAHEIKNPLTPIKLSVQHLRRAYADRRADFGEILETNVEHVLAEIDRLGEIARAFSRYGLPAEAAGPLEAVDVGAVVHETLALYRSGDTRVRYREEVDPDVPPGCSRAAELKEVLVNLLENARAAIDGAGAVTVEVGSRSGEIELAVRDDGSGIPPELLPRIFEPHFSTRTSGTGLGLAIVRRLVEGWGGRIEVESDAGAGTRVQIVIPGADQPVAGGGS